MSSKTTSWILELVDKITAPLRSVQGAADDAADSADRLGNELNDASSAGDNFNRFATEFGAKAFLFNQAADGVAKFSSYFKDTIAPGVELETQMADLSAVTQKTGDDLKAIRERAQDLASTFGGEATKHAESFKMVIAKFGPDIADSDEALGKMGENIAILSKSMGGDATKAADALTTAMLQYGVDLTNPMKASEEMTRIMNLLVAGGNAGSSEVMDTAEALKVVGLTARQQGVSMEEFTASMQALAQGSLTGSEAGTKFRNVLMNIASENMIPKNTVDALKAAGVNMSIVTDNSLSLTDRMRELSKVAGTDLILQMFGVNSGAAELLMEQIDQIDTWKEEITDTTAAVDAADIIMNTYQETMDRIRQGFNNFKADVFEAIKPLAPFVSLTGDAISGAADLGVAVWGLSILFKKDLYTGIWTGIKAVATFVKTSITGAFASGGAFTTLSGVVSVACKAIGIAIMNIPIIGWIAAAVAALTGLGVYFYNTSATFRGFLWGIWEAVKTVFSGIGGFITEVLEGVWHLIKGVFNPANWFDDDYKFSDGLDRITSAAKSYGESIGSAFQEGKAAGMADFEEKKSKKNGSSTALDIYMPSNNSVGAVSVTGGRTTPVKPLNQTPTGGSSKNTISGASGGSGGGKSVTMNVTLNIHNSGIKNPDEFTEQVVRKINDRLNDALAAVS
jgi:TP901 family phage tail tape measure protein